MKVYNVYGPPGTGKSTFLSHQINAAVKKYGPHKVLVASFTKAAAVEIASRDIIVDEHMVATIHAHCYRALGMPSIAEKHIKEWNDEHPAYRMSGGGTDVDDPYGDAGMAEDGDALLREVNILRARMIDWKLWPLRPKAFSQKWDEWKARNEYIDFTGMIERALCDMPIAPGNPAVIIVDEYQDCTPLEVALLKQWSKHTESTVYAFDDDQCHPPDTKILTSNRGYIPISELDPTHDRVVSWARGGGDICRSKGYVFDVAVRSYSGNLIRIQTGNKNVEVTPNHKMFARWQNNERTLVYLMQKGAAWRVGTTRFFRSNKGHTGTFGLSFRARSEGATAAWILRAFENMKEARFYEDEISMKYGISKYVFSIYSYRKTAIHTQEELDAHHNHIARYGHPITCLREHGRDERYPIWEKDSKNSQYGISRKSKLFAANLDDSEMVIPVDDGLVQPSWHSFVRTDKQYEGQVFSLNVKPHHSYVANGIVVENSIYQFKGSDPNLFINTDLPDDQKRILSQSYRLPRAVYKLAERLVRRISRRQAKDYKPRDEEGEVHTDFGDNYKCPDEIVRKAVSLGAPCMILASCSYMLAPTIACLREMGQSFHNPYRLKNAAWNPLGERNGVSMKDRLLAFLAPFNRDTLWTGKELRNWASIVSKDSFIYGGKERLKYIDENGTVLGSELTEIVKENKLAELMSVMDGEPKDAVGWLRPHIIPSKAQAFHYPAEVFMRRGAWALSDKPLVTVGTIHSVKGGESENVFLYPDISPQGMELWCGRAEDTDTILRQFYVGTTRARQRLFITCPAGERSVDIQ